MFYQAKNIHYVLKYLSTCYLVLFIFFNLTFYYRFSVFISSTQILYQKKKK